VKLVQKSLDSQRYREITDWLSSTDFPAQQSDFIGRRQEGTGVWFVSSPEFTTWLQGSKQILFCPGIPGAGKTMIAATVVDHLWKTFQNDDIGIAYIYCDYKRGETQTTTDLLAAILKQLVQERPLFGEPLVTLYKQHSDRRTRPSLNEILSALLSVISNYSRVYIVIDALDECADTDGTRSKLLAELFGLRTKTDTSLMATSRFVPKVVQYFEGFPTLEIRASDDDVKQFVVGQMHRLPNCIRSNNELQTEIQDRIVRAVDGMFLLAHLHLESLRGKLTKKAVQSALVNLSGGSEALNRAYDEAIGRIKELSHALAVEVGERELDEDNVPDIEDMVSVCAGLVTVDKESNIIRLVHLTTQEYFERIREDWNPTAQEEIASTCLTYLSFQTFDTGWCTSDEDLEHRINQNPFLDYAARYWGIHALTVQKTIKKLALPFLRNMNQVSCSIQIMYVPQYKFRGYSQHFPMHVTGMHLAATFGIVCLIQELMLGDGDKHRMQADAPDSHGRTPLSWAAGGGHEAVVKLLLETGEVDVDSKDEYGRTPLLLAAEGGHEAVVKLLLETGEVDVDSKDNGGRTPLSWTAFRGHEAVVKLLLETGKVDVDSKEMDGETPLSLAAEGGHEAVVKLLLETGEVDVDSKDEYGRTPLSRAAEGGHEAMVKLLLETGKVDVDSKDEYG
ncbi:ankyrin, partial [Lepidopterella palustris CBS 459.81]